MMAVLGGSVFGVKMYMFLATLSQVAGTAAA
jgi:hypothetical protein